MVFFGQTIGEGSIWTELVKLGIGGVVGAIFFWLYLQERTDRKDIQSKLAASEEARRVDAIEMYKQMAPFLSSIAQTTNSIADTLERTGKGS